MTHTATMSDRILDLLEPFIEDARVQQTLTGESLSKYRRAIESFTQVVGNLQLGELQPQILTDLKRQLVDRVGPVHINGILYAIKRFSAYCRTLGLQVTDLSEVRPLRVPRRAVTYLTSDELEQFFAVIKIQCRNGTMDLHGLGFRALVEVLASTGMRISEALALNVASIDWRDHEAKIIGKGNKERVVFFSERAIRWLRRYLDARQDRKPALFISARAGCRLWRGEAERLCRTAAGRAGLTKRITLHVLRHTFATTLLRNGCPIGHIQGMLGHERLETTCRYYLGIIDNQEMKKAHERYLRV